MLKRKLIYTAITRAKKTLLLIGDPSAMQYGIRRIEIERRTILKEELKKYLHATSIKDELKKFESLDSLDDDLGAVETFIDLDDFN
jgi:superfamily I DNA/RNA helicase